MLPRRFAPVWTGITSKKKRNSASIMPIPTPQHLQRSTNQVTVATAPPRAVDAKNIPIPAAKQTMKPIINHLMLDIGTTPLSAVLWCSTRSRPTRNPCSGILSIPPTRAVPQRDLAVAILWMPFCECHLKSGIPHSDDFVQMRQYVSPHASFPHLLRNSAHAITLAPEEDKKPPIPASAKKNAIDGRACTFVTRRKWRAVYMLCQLTDTIGGPPVPSGRFPSLQVLSVNAILWFSHGMKVHKFPTKYFLSAFV